MVKNVDNLWPELKLCRNKENAAIVVFDIKATTVNNNGGLDIVNNEQLFVFLLALECKQ